MVLVPVARTTNIFIFWINPFRIYDLFVEIKYRTFKTMSHTGFFTTMEPYVNEKIKRNNMMINSLELQNIILEKEIILNFETSKVNKKKIEIIKKINEYEAKQAYNFLQQTEEITRALYNETNSIHVNNYENMKAEIIKLHEKCRQVLQQVIESNDNIMRTFNYANVEFEFSENPEPNILE